MHSVCRAFRNERRTQRARSPSSRSRVRCPHCCAVLPCGNGPSARRSAMSDPRASAARLRYAADRLSLRCPAARRRAPTGRSAGPRPGRRSFRRRARHSMLGAGEGQPEAIEPVIERLTAMVMPSALVSVKSDRPRRPGSSFLAEDHVLFGAIERPPGIDAPLQRASVVGVRSGCRRRSSSSTPITGVPGGSL